MNNPLLLALPALATTMAFSAYQTMPMSLRSEAVRHDLAGKSPLAASKMALARGAGSSCQPGCTENQNIPCTAVRNQDVPWHPIIRVFRQTWFPHDECRFAWGADTCANLGDEICNKVENFPLSDPNCTGSPTSTTETWTSTCVKPVPVPPGGP